MINRALSLHHMRLEDIQVVHMEFSAHEQGFMTNKVDAVVNFEPVRTRLLNAGVVEVFSGKEIPNEIVDVLVIHE